MIETLKNAFANKEIRIKMWYTLGIILIFRLGCYIPVPGLDIVQIQNFLQTSGQDSVLNIMSIVSGGALANGTLFALGITPYINAFIIMQLLTLIIPKLEEMSKQGEEGRKKMTQITRYVALGLALIQAIGIMISFKQFIKPAFGEGTEWLTMSLVIAILISGSAIVMWLGERITEYGIGNGTSLIIFIGILSGAGSQLIRSFDAISKDPVLAWNLFGFAILLVAIFAFIVFVDGAERRIQVQYAKQIKGNKMYGGQKTHIPIRINGSGVMPIIFANAFLLFPQMIIGLFWPNSDAYVTYQKYFGSGTAIFYIFTVLLILFFAYFYAQIQFNPEDVSKNLQQYGGFVQGIRPGKPTTMYLAKISNRITLFGAIFLALISIIPTFMFNAVGKPIMLNSAFSAVGLLIIVSVALEFNQQLESLIMMRHYKGFLK